MSSVFFQLVLKIPETNLPACLLQLEFLFLYFGIHKI
jgi:hypothetical protein